MTQYRIDVRNSPNWRRYKAATLGVSVNSPRWQGDKFAAILDFAAANFDTIRIDVTDALYRHMFAVQGMSADAALNHANSVGALWLAQHCDMIDTCPIKPQIVRWAEWYKHPDYEMTLEAFRLAYTRNSKFKEAIHNDIMDYYQRRVLRPTEDEYQASRDYILEEVAIMSLQGRTLPSLEVYPGNELNALKIVRACQIPEAPKGLELSQFCKIKFSDRPEQNYKASTAESLTLALG